MLLKLCLITHWSLSALAASYFWYIPVNPFNSNWTVNAHTRTEILRVFLLMELRVTITVTLWSAVAFHWLGVHDENITWNNNGLLMFSQLLSTLYLGRKKWKKKAGLLFCSEKEKMCSELFCSRSRHPSATAECAVLLYYFNLETCTQGSSLWKIRMFISGHWIAFWFSVYTHFSFHWVCA